MMSMLGAQVELVSIYINNKIIIEIFSFIVHVTFMLFIFRKQRTILRFVERAG